MRIAALAFMMLLLQTNGCDQSPHPVAASKAAPYQRFVPMPRQPENVQGVPWSGAFALDTKTGQLCRTYDGGVTEKWDGLVPCIDLFNKYPD